jgi:hypothetical protein
MCSLKSLEQETFKGYNHRINLNTILHKFCKAIVLEYHQDQSRQLQSENTELRLECVNLHAQIIQYQTEYQLIYDELQAAKQTISAQTSSNLKPKQDQLIYQEESKSQFNSPHSIICAAKNDTRELIKYDSNTGTITKYSWVFINLHIT